MKVLESTGAFALWEQALKALPIEGQSYTDQDDQTCKEFADAVIVLSGAADATLLIQAIRRTLPALYPSVEEFHAQTFATDRATFEWSIGSRTFGELSQIESFLIPLLQEHPTSRRGIVLCYNPLIDSHAHSANVPAVISLQFRILSGKLHVTTNLRSCDAFLGLPANLWQTRALQEYVASKLNVGCGPITLMVASLHWFDHYNDEAPAVVSSVRRLLAANASDTQTEGTDGRKLYK